MNHRISKLTSSSDRPLFAFFILVILISTPLWIIGGFTDIQLLPGLPVDALIALCPGIAALILYYKSDGKSGMQELIKRAFDFKRVKRKLWYLPSLLIMPVVNIMAFIALRLMGTTVPNPEITLLQTSALCIVFFISAVGEELGWSAYATEPMQKRFGALGASIVLGLIWAAFHYIALIHVHRPMAWVAWWSLGTVCLRVICIWLYNNMGKSVFAVALFHMSINVTWQLFPINGSYYNPQVNGLILLVIVTSIVLIWGPRTLMGRRKQRDL